MSPSLAAPPPAAIAVVVGRYVGTVEVLAGILRGAGVVVAATAALDSGGPAAVCRVLDGRTRAVVVMTVAPSDATSHLVIAAASADRVVAVAWHPPDERPPLPGGVTMVVAGHIHRDLAAAVRARS